MNFYLDLLTSILEVTRELLYCLWDCCRLVQRTSAQNPSLRLQAIFEEFLQAYIFPRAILHKNSIRNKLIEICTDNSPKRFVHEGSWEVLDEGVGGSLTTHLQEVCDQLQRVNKV